MECNNLNNLTSCNEMAANGIKSITLFPFGDLFDYVYTDDNLNKVTNYRQASSGATYNTYAQSSLNGDMAGNKEFNHTLTVFIPALSQAKRNEFEKLIRMELTIMVTDRNGKVWLFGQDTPAKLTSYSLTTGGDSNTYQLTFTNRTKHQVREIQGFNAPCLFSFNGTPLYSSTFTIPSASTADWTGLYEIFDGTSTLSTTPTPFTPLSWTTPSIYNRDLSSFEGLLGIGGWQINQFMYDAGTDEVTIQILSSTIFYPVLGIAGVSYNAALNGVVNLNIVAGTVQLGSTVTVVDSLSNVIYTGLLTDSIDGGIYGTDVQGTVQDAYINVTNLYPSGTTFTATVTGSCGTSNYEYVSPPIEGCYSECTFSINDGVNYSLQIYKAQGDFAYQKTQLNFNGNIILLYPGYRTYHNSFSQFITDITNQVLANPTLPIDVTSLQFEDSVSYVLMKFKGNNSDIIATSTIWNDRAIGFGTEKQYMRQAYATQSTVLALQALVSNDSNITITDVSLDTLVGTYNNAPITNTGYTLEEVPTVTNNTINSIGFNINDYNETDTFEVSTISALCPDSTINVEVVACNDGFTKTTPSKYYLFKLPCIGISDSLGDKLFFETQDADFDIFFSSDLTYLTITQACEAFVSAGITPYNIFYLPAEQTWYFELITSNPIYNIYCYENTSYATLELECNVHNYKLNQELHPSVQAKWNFPTIYPIEMQQYTQDSVKQPMLFNRRTQYNIAEFSNASAGNFVINFVMNNVINIRYIVEFYSGYPSVATYIGDFTVNQPTVTASVDIQTLFGAAYTSIRYILVTDSQGTYVIKPFNPNTDSDITLYVETYTKFANVFGRYKDFNVLYPTGQEHAATLEITSTLCPAILPQNVIWWISSNDYNVSSLQFNQPIMDDTNVTITQGSNTVTYSGSEGVELQVGSYVSFEGFTNHYIIESIGGGVITLNNPIVEDSGTYKIQLGRLPVLTDKTGNKTIDQPGSDSLMASLIYNKLNNYQSLYFTHEAVYQVTPVVNPDDHRFAVMIVAKPNTLSSFDFIYSNGNQGSYPFFNIKYDSPTDLLAESITDSGSFNEANVTTLNGDFQILYGYLFDDVIRVGVDGTYQEETVSPFAGSYDSGYEAIGGQSVGGGFDVGFCGDIIEMFAFDETSAGVREWNEGYVAHKYNLQGSLPIGHPYKVNPPSL